MRYALLQLPGTALLIAILFLIRRWIILPDWLVWGLVVLSLVKDVVLFPFVWRAYDPGDPDAHLGVGLRGAASTRLAPLGHVRVGAELWRAEALGRAIEAGEPVRIRARRGLTLLVEAEEEGAEQPRSGPAASG